MHPKHKHYEDRLTVPMDGLNKVLTTQFGLSVCNGYQRVVVGDRGPYVECDSDQIIMNNLFIHVEDSWRCKEHGVFYIHYRTLDNLVKVYYQLKTVDYADYKIGFFYMSPFDLFCNGVNLIMPLRKQKNEETLFDFFKDGE